MQSLERAPETQYADLRAKIESEDASTADSAVSVQASAVLDTVAKLRKDVTDMLKDTSDRLAAVEGTSNALRSQLEANLREDTDNGTGDSDLTDRIDALQSKLIALIAEHTVTRS